ncbi:MAG: sigma-54 dependent transcriptional regulator [Terriglobales bacterium]|jgi:DNA-binding NtrC family response regulator
MPAILVVDDDPAMLRYLKALLETEEYQVSTANDGAEAIQLIRQGARPDAVLLDMTMPRKDGLDTLLELRDLVPEVKAIMVSGISDTHTVVQAMRLGAQDYLTKPVNDVELAGTLRRCLQSGAIEDHDAEVEELEGDSFFAASSPVMRKIRSHVACIAEVNVPVLLLGESGTGKEIIALMIHRHSPRAHRKFLKVNCAAIPEDLLESELFGFEAGAFTGANQTKPGKFELCDHGTILLDEIGEMGPRLQAKLLQVLQEQKFFRLGSRSAISVDVRILAATNVQVEEAIKDGRLRLDLYYRLNGFSVCLPPLRDRREDIPILMHEFMQRLARSMKRPPQPISEPLIKACKLHAWPGHVRELQSFIKRFLVLGNEDAMIAELRAQGAEARPLHAAPRKPGSTRDLKKMMRGIKGEAEAEAISRALEQTRWNRKEAAELLNISYKALVYKARQYGLMEPKAEKKEGE